MAIERGLTPLLSGRNPETLEYQASELDLDYEVATLDDADSLRKAMSGVPVVLNCAGPFVRTASQVVDACLRSGTHYLDVTGEPPVYEMVASHNGDAIGKGLMLLPSVGFDVVPTDCLAAHLFRRLPSATHLALAFHQNGPAALPPGTLNTSIEMIPYGSSKQHRVEGNVVAAPQRKTRTIDFGDGDVTASMLTWGDVFLAYRSTGIPNIEDYVVFPPQIIKQMDLTDRIRPLFHIPMVREAAKRAMRGGSSEEQLAATATSVWGEVTDATGRRAVSRLHGPEAGVVWTSRSALDVVRHVMDGDVTPGFQTPSTAYGPDLVLEAEGITREDVE
jgi:short subunit dehydrogenase-like uncharacterized protein